MMRLFKLNPGFSCLSSFAFACLTSLRDTTSNRLFHPQQQIPMNSKSWQALRWLETQADQMAKDLIELCNINSGSDNPQGLCRAADWLEEFFKPLSVPCQRIDLPSYQLLDDAAKESSYQTGPALRWDLGNPHSQGILWQSITIRFTGKTIRSNLASFCQTIICEAQGLSMPKVVSSSCAMQP